MAEPKVWNKRDPNCPKDAVYVGRPTRWGNPYAIGCLVEGQGRRRMTREDVLVLFAGWVRLPAQAPLREAAKHELRGKDLSCWCVPLDCHAYIWMEIANAQ